MKLLRSLVIASLVVAAPALASAQERIALTPASGVNVHPGYLQAAGDLFRGHLQSTGRYQVVVVPGQNGSAELSAQQAVEAGRSAQANQVAVLHIVRLSASAKVRLAVYDVGTGQLLRLEQMTAATPDDVDIVTERLAESLSTGKSVEDSAAIDTVTQKESDPYLKLTATNVWGIKLGVSAPINTTEDGEHALPGLALFWLYDARTFLAELEFGFHDQDDDADIYVGLGTYYPLSKSNTTPFLGGAVRYAEAVGGDGSGIQVAAVAGMLIGRLSTVQIRGDVQYFVNTFESDRQYYVDSTGGYAHDTANAHGFLFNVGMGF